MTSALVMTVISNVANYLQHHLLVPSVTVTASANEWLDDANLSAGCPGSCVVPQFVKARQNSNFNC